MELNPYADENGFPKKGKETEFFEWIEKNWIKHLDSLTDSEKQKHLNAAISINKK